MVSVSHKKYKRKREGISDIDDSCQHYCDVCGKVTDHHPYLGRLGGDETFFVRCLRCKMARWNITVCYKEGHRIEQ